MKYSRKNKKYFLKSKYYNNAELKLKGGAPGVGDDSGTYDGGGGGGNDGGGGGGNDGGDVMSVNADTVVAISADDAARANDDSSNPIYDTSTEIKKQAEELFEEMIDDFALLYGTDYYDIKDKEQPIQQSSPNNEKIKDFLDDFKIKDKLAKTYTDNLTVKGLKEHIKNDPDTQMPPLPATGIEALQAQQTTNTFGGAKAKLQVDKRKGLIGKNISDLGSSIVYLFTGVRANLGYKGSNFTDADFYNLTQYYIEITWPIYIILKTFINKNSLIKSFMDNYINKIFDLTNNKKLNAIKSSPDAYRSISNILITEVFFDIIKNYIAMDIENYDYKYIETYFMEDEEPPMDNPEKNNNVFIKLSFNQSELIKFLVDSFDKIGNLGSIVNKQDGIEKIKKMYSEKIKKILHIIESEEDVREKFNYITDDLNSIFNLQGTNILKPYRDTIKKIDKAIDDFDGPANSVLIEELFKSYLPSFKFDNNKITIDLDNIEFTDRLEGKQLQAIQQKIKQRQDELDNLKKLVQQTGNSLQEEE